MRKSWIYFLCCFIYGHGLLFAQEYDFEFVTIDDGLSQSSINAVVQDAKGFLWLGTQDGLNRFDGHQFTIYKKDPFDSTSLASNFITALLTDQEDQLWVGTHDGLHIFDPKTESFQRFKNREEDPQSISDDRITCLYQDLDQNIWVGTTNGFNLLKRSNNKQGTRYHFERFQYQEKTMRSEPGPTYITQVLQDQEDNYWVGTYDGLFKYQKSDREQDANEQQAVPFLSDQAIIYSDIRVRSLTHGPKQSLWIGSSKGLIEYFPKQSKFTIHLAGDTPNSLKSDYISFLQSTNDGNLLIGTEVGIYRAVFEKDQKMSVGFEQLDGAASQQNNLQGKIFNNMFEDQIRKDFYWLGTMRSGLCKMYRKKKKFYTERFDGISEIMGKTAVFHLIEDQKGWLWMTTEGRLFRYEVKTGAFRIDDLIPSTGRPLNTFRISNLSIDSAGQVWASTFQGLYRLEEKANGQLFARPFLAAEDCKDLGTFAFLETEEAYFVGTYHGINRLDKKSGEMGACSQVVDSIGSRQFGYRVNCLYRDRKNNLWVGSSIGLALYRNVKGPLEQIFDQQALLFKYDPGDPNSLVDNFIFHMTEDLKGRIWLGTQNGLVQVSMIGNQVDFKRYSEEDGLANNVVYGILEDDKTGHLWLSTNNGLSRFDPQTLQFENFDAQDGLQGSEFNAGAFCKGKDGRFYFGGLEGISWFRPEDIQLERVRPPVWMTKLNVNEGGVYNLLRFDEKETIHLDYRDNSFSIHFTGIDYLHPNDLTYSYDLEGSELKDVGLGRSNQINFTNLAPGNYTLCVKATGKGGLSNQLGDSLQLYIAAPFWQRPWFYAFLCLSLILALWGIYQLNYRIQMSKINEIERVRRDAARDFHDELGSKLSIISMYSMLAKDQTQQSKHAKDEYLGKVINTSNSLHDSMRNLLWTLNPEADTVHDLFLQLKDFGEEVFSHSGIDFESEGLAKKMEQIQLSMEYKRHLLLIFKEAMNNVLRHAECSRVILKMQMTKEILVIELNDNGKGFASIDNLKGDGLNNMKSRAKKMGAKLLIRNQDGTQVKLTCLLGKMT